MNSIIFLWTYLYCAEENEHINYDNNSHKFIQTNVEIMCVQCIIYRWMTEFET